MDNSNQFADAKPLQLAYFDENKESFSARIVRELRDSTFFRPRLKKDNTVADSDMLLVASAVIAAADQQIRSMERVNSRLEQRLSWWNEPMFQKALPAAIGGGELPPKDNPADPLDTEIGKFAKLITVRNLCSLLVVLCSALWVVFTWYSSDKSAQLEHVKSLLAASEKRAADTELSKGQVEKDFAFYKDNVGEVTTNAEKYRTANAKLTGDNQALHATIDSQRLTIESQKTENSKLIDKLAAVKACSAGAAPSAQAPSAAKP